MKKQLLAAAVMVALALPSAASAATSDSQVWTTANLTVKLADKWRLQNELVLRFSDNRDGLYEIENNTLLGYKLNSNLTLWGGYTFNPQYSHGDLTTREHRLREQLTADKLAMIGNGKLSGRLRTEQRWRENADGTGWRVRPYLKYALPLGAKSKTALILTHESFLNLNTTPFQNRRDYRMRNLVGISTPLSKQFSLEAGYMNQYTFVHGRTDTSDNILSLTLGASL
ncbi:DUF2490 domain-containing protein [Sphingomonas ginkgonis]|uniref:DUF2490 domain-containing protein n=1 Tax=Sphingomonas ginkgonis TaxID=2315330 RepID=A0A429V6T4_9SPHN|nr:DUF2490 domain-containing protein [Sphingomonas ginkgonis]RST29661.1 DUF2490 domain-containing protein [Sphingomonas ginkgonis]